jgi:hypothetical protein
MLQTLGSIPVAPKKKKKVSMVHAYFSLGNTDLYKIKYVIIVRFSVSLTK